MAPVARPGVFHAFLAQAKAAASVKPKSELVGALVVK